jgi:hypothetical protein
MSGPRASSLGNEQGTLNNFVMKGQGGDHITSSQIIDDGTTVRIPGNLQVTGSLSGSSAVFSSTLSATNLTAEGSPALGGIVSIRQDATYLPKGNGYSSIASSFSVFEFYGYTGASTYKNFALAFSGLTDNTRRTYTLPDGSGTLALTGDLINYVTLGTNQSISGTKTFSSPLTGSSATFNGVLTATDGTQGLRIRAYTDGSGFGAIYSTGVTANESNFALIASSTQTWLNSTSNVYLSINGSAVLSIASNNASFANNVTAGGNITSGTGAFNTGGFFIPYSTSSASSRNWKITNDQEVFGDFSIKQSSTQTGLPDTYRFYINNIGQVAIGTANPAGNGSQKFVVQAAATAEIARFTDGTNGDLVIDTPTTEVVRITAQYGGGGNLVFARGTGRTESMRITSTGTVQPGANGTQDLGTSSLRWATVFTSDLSLSNGIGDYTIVEGENDLFLYNNKQNKVYKFVVEEVDPSTATPKKS